MTPSPVAHLVDKVGTKDPHLPPSPPPSDIATTAVRGTQSRLELPPCFSMPSYLEKDLKFLLIFFFFVEMEVTVFYRHQALTAS